MNLISTENTIHLELWTGKPSAISALSHKPEINLWIPLKGLYLAHISKSNQHLPVLSIDIYIPLLMQHLIDTEKHIVRCNGNQNTQISTHQCTHHVYTQWSNKETLNSPHQQILQITKPHINTDTQQCTYLMLREDRWVVVLIQNFNYHSAGTVQPCRKSKTRLMVTSSQYHYYCYV